MKFIIKKFFIITCLYLFYLFKTICIRNPLEEIEDFGIISLMYHRFEENKYPSTNIKIKDFKKHLEIIEENKIKFINPKNFENELKNNKLQKKDSFNY